MALIWSAAPPMVFLGRGAVAVGGGNRRMKMGREGGWCMPSVTLRPPGTPVPGVEGGLVGLERWRSGWCWVGMSRKRE